MVCVIVVGGGGCFFSLVESKYRPTCVCVCVEGVGAAFSGGWEEARDRERPVNEMKTNKQQLIELEKGLN